MAGGAAALAASIAGGTALSSGTSSAVAPAVREMEQTANAKFPNLLPSPAAIAAAANNGVITEGEASIQLLYHGIFTGADGLTVTKADDARGRIWQFEFDQLRRQLSAEESIALWFRSNITPRDLKTGAGSGISLKELRERMRRNGFWGQRDQDKRIELAQQLPSPSDLILFSTREVWDDKVADFWGYDTEFSGQFNAWMQHLGFRGPAVSQQDLTTQSKIQSWAQAFWRAHWRVLSTTQAFEAFHRLRPPNIERGGIKAQPRDPAGQVFDRAALDTVLRIADFPPRARRILESLSFRVLTRVDIRRAFMVGSIDENELHEQHLDIGFAEREANILDDLLIKTKRINESKRTVELTKARVLEAYKVGVIDSKLAGDSLQALDDVLTGRAERGKGGVLPARPPESGEVNRFTAALADADFVLRISLVKRAISSVRKRFLAGKASEQDARVQLINLGVFSRRREEFLTHWKIELDKPERELTSSQIQRLFSQGLIDRVEAVRRLGNLRFDVRTANAILALAADDRDAREARAMTRDARTKRQKVAGAAREVKSLRKLIDRAQTVLRSNGTPTQLLRWVSRGLLPLESAIARLIALGFSERDAANFLKIDQSGVTKNGIQR